MKIQKILKRLLQLHPKSVDLSLDRIKRLLKDLNNPEKKIINAINKTLIFIVLHHTEKKAKIKLVFLCWDLLFRRKYGTS